MRLAGSWVGLSSCRLWGPKSIRLDNGRLQYLCCTTWCQCRLVRRFADCKALPVVSYSCKWCYIKYPTFNLTFLTHTNVIAHQLILVIFARDAADREYYQTLICYPTSPNYCICTTWEMLKCKNCIFSPTCSISALLDFNQLLAKFIQSCYSQLMMLLLCGSLNLVVIGDKLWIILGPLPRRMGVLHYSSWTVLNAIAISALYC